MHDSRLSKQHSRMRLAVEIHRQSVKSKLELRAKKTPWNLGSVFQIGGARREESIMYECIRVQSSRDQLPRLHYLN